MSKFGREELVKLPAYRDYRSEADIARAKANAWRQARARDAAKVAPALAASHGTVLRFAHNTPRR